MSIRAFLAGIFLTLGLAACAGDGDDDTPGATPTPGGETGAASGFVLVETDHGTFEVPEDWKQESAPVLGETNVVNFMQYDGGKRVGWLNAIVGNAPEGVDVSDLAWEFDDDAVHKPLDAPAEVAREQVEVAGAVDAYLTTESEPTQDWVELLAVNADGETLGIHIASKDGHWEPETVEHIIDSVRMR